MQESDHVNNDTEPMCTRYIKNLEGLTSWRNTKQTDIEDNLLMLIYKLILKNDSDIPLLIFNICV